MGRVILLLGSNLGNRYQFLQIGKDQLMLNGASIISESSIYETAHWGSGAGDAYLNQAIMIQTEQLPIDLINSIQIIENQFDRDRSQPNLPRCLDIDILLFDQIRCDTDQLQIPHPRLHLRKFALIPTAEIAANWWHPTLNKTIREVLKTCEDSTPVAVWNPHYAI